MTLLSLVTVSPSKLFGPLPLISIRIRALLTVEEVLAREPGCE